MPAMSQFIPFIFVGFIVLFVVVLVGGVIRAKRRREALRKWARRHHLRYDNSKDWSIDEHYPDFKCLHKGDDRYAHNRLLGQWRGRPLHAFDYHYQTHVTDAKGNRSTHTHRFSAVILGSHIPLKPLQIRHENLFDKIGGFFGFEDIDFESAAFSREFHVAGPDRRWAYDVLHPRAIQFLLDAPRYTILFGPGCVCACRTSRFEPAEFGEAADVVTQLLDMIPDYLVQQQSGQKADLPQG